MKLGSSLDEVTYPIALDIFRQLLEYLPRMLVIVMDGLEKVNSWVEDAVIEILTLLQKSYAYYDDGQGQPDQNGTDLKLLKILYTTAGNCEVLDKVQSDLEERMVMVKANGLNAYRARSPARKGLVDIEMGSLQLYDSD